jgi:DNA-binding MarR family transcriptional regulator
MEASVSELDELIHQTVRLRVMASLVTLAPREQLDFTRLRDLLEVTDGNLGAHLLKLEEAGYIRVEKTFVARKPRTFVNATAKGRSAFEEHVKALEGIIKASEKRGRKGS